MTVRVTAVSAGAVEYLLRGAGCAEHEHRPSGAEQGLAQDGAGYLLRSAEHEAAGVWLGRGLDMVGKTAGERAEPDDVRAVFGRLQHPTLLDPETGEPLALGSRPRRYKSPEERIDAATLKLGPDATAEQIDAARNKALGDGRKAVAYYDVTFSPAKSVSVMYTALLVGGDEAGAARVAAAHHKAVAAAMAWADEQVAYTRAGYHGKTVDGRSVGEFQQGVGLVMTAWQHTTSRAQEPQLHTHVGVLNRVVSVVDGVIRALDGKGFKPIKMGMDAIYRATYEAEISAGFGVVFALRSDGKAREIMGIDQRLLDAASSRSPQVQARATQLVAGYVAMHGRAPGPRARRNLVQQAARESRARKSHRPPFTLLRNWAADKGPALAESLRTALEIGAQVRRDGHPDQRDHGMRSREQVLAAAVASVQTKYADWTIGNLIDAIGTEVKRTPAVTGTLTELAAEVLREPQRFGIVLAHGQEIAPVPVALQRADGRSKYRPLNDQRYTTIGQLSTERQIVARARELTAQRLSGPERELAHVELIAAGLGPEQAAAVLHVMSSGRAADVLIGPAGAGKSHTVGVLASQWETRFGGRVIGLATSQAATLQLQQALHRAAGDGRNAEGLVALNTTQFLHRFTPDGNGHVRDRVRPGDLFIIDEAGMCSTTELDAVSRLVAAGGAKLLYTGDHEQLTNPDAGGMLALLVADNGAVELVQIARFTHAWEGPASARLRVGDDSVLRDYEQRGRLRGGTVEEMRDAAMRGYLADTLAGRESLLVVGSNAEAAQLSGEIRAELLRLGRISPEVLGTLADGNLVSVGDVIQARRNDPTLRVEGAGMVTNRVSYRILGVDDHGLLLAQDRNGLVAHLPRAYLENHVTLGYASTVYAAQGRTVDTCHALLDQFSSRVSAYVALTRGRLGNFAYAITHRTPDHHDVQRLDTTPRQLLAGVLGNIEHGVAAELTRRDGHEAHRSIAQVGTEWDHVTTEYGRDRYTDTLAALLPEAGWMDLITDEVGYGRLMRAVREAELAGHDPAAVLTEAVRARSLVGADSMSDVLRWRVRIVQNNRTPERDVPTGDWTALVAPMAGPVGVYAHQMAVAATQRQAELGAHVAEQRPAWAVQHLGQPPVDARQRAEWERRAGVAAAYRELRNVPETSVSLGAAPPREQVFHRVLWQHAYAALGAPADALDYAAASEGELREMREVWRREQSFAPYYVETELRDARLAAEDFHRDATVWASEAQHLPAGSGERALADVDVDAARHLAELYAARAEHLAAVHGAREHWAHRSETAQLRATLAGDELERRGLERDPGAVAGEQLELIAVVDRHPSARERSAPDAQLRLDLDLSPADATVTRIVEDGARSEARSERRRAPQPDAVDVHAAGNELRGDTASSELTGAVHDPDGPQAVLFPVQPDPAHVAAAQPLRPQPPTEVAGQDARGPGQEEVGPVTVGQARHQAEVIARLRAEHDQRPNDAADQVRAWQAQRAAGADTDEGDRQRRDTAEHDGPVMDRSLDASEAPSLGFGS